MPCAWTQQRFSGDSFMFYCLRRWLLPLLLLAPHLVWSQSPPMAKTTPVSPSLAHLYAAAWQRHPAYAALAARDAQYAASSQLAQSVIAGVPSASVGYRSDAVTSAASRTGLREWELGINTPLALGDRKRLAGETARAQQEAYAAEVQKTQWLLAAELRDVYWAWQLAHIEHLLLDDEVARAQTLANDSQRRTQAGETPRVDTLQAQSVLGLARVNLAESLQKEAQALAALQRLTGAAPLAKVSEAALSSYQLEVLKTEPIASHPELAAAQSQWLLSKAKLEAALRVKGEPPTLGTGFSRETTTGTSAFTTARLSLNFALGSDKRYAPKIAEASAEAIEREIILLRSTEQVAQEIALAKLALESANTKKRLAQDRAATSTETAQLFAKAFALGELDMPTRLRVEADRASAVLAMNRAVIEHAVAISKLNQLLGYLP
jgi:outer membrane protein, heavy metal efflux system